MAATWPMRWMDFTISSAPRSGRFAEVGGWRVGWFGLGWVVGLVWLVWFGWFGLVGLVRVGLVGCLGYVGWLLVC